MIIVLKPECTNDQLEQLIERLTSHYDLQVNTWVDIQRIVLDLIGNTSIVGTGYTAAQDLVESAKRMQEPYKKANHKFHPDSMVTTLPGGWKAGDGLLTLIASPCSVEGEEQIRGIAGRIKTAGAKFLHDGVFEPCASPYFFQGMKAEGFGSLSEAEKKIDLPIVTEVMCAPHLEPFEDVDIIQVDARNMQNFELLKEPGKINKLILLKRGLSSTIEELLMSVECIMVGGNEQVILCERGIRTFESYIHNTLDISAAPVLKKLSYLPVVVDSSHTGGIAWLIEPLAMAAVAAGADGLIIGVHNDPPHALSDGAQSLAPDQFDRVSSRLFEVGKVFGKTR